MRTIDKRRFIWIGNGTNIKSLLYRGEAARACVITALFPSVDIRIYNVYAQPTTMNEVIEGLAKALERHLPRFHLPASLVLQLADVLTITRNRGRLSDLRTTLEKWIADDAYDASQFRETFGFQTEVGLTEDLRREVEWYRSHTHYYICIG